MSNAVRLETDQGVYTGWQSVSITRSLEQTTNAFNLGVTQAKAKWLQNNPIQVDSRCRILLNDTPMINGFVDDVMPSFDATSHKINISGRDITEDLVDSAAIIPNQELLNVTLKTAAELLCLPYRVKVHCPDAGKVFDKIVVNDGDSVFEALEPYARQQQFLLFTNGDGVLHIRKPTIIDLGLRLQEDKHFKSGSAVHSNKNRYYRTVVKSQSAGSQHALKGEYIDKDIRKTRTRIIRAERSTKSCQERAEWEAKVQKAKSRTAQITVQGWEYTKDKVWPLAALITLYSPRLGYNQPMLVNSTEFSVNDSGGTLTTLSLVDPAVYA